MSRRRHWGGFGGFEEFISERSGIVSRSELLHAGWTPDELRIAFGLGNLRRLRRGWYRSSDVPPEVVRAWQHGGPLACVSALRWYGVTPLEVSEVDDGVLHICLPRHTHRRRIECPDPGPVVVHWDDAGESPRALWAVPPDVAFAQARHCTAARRA